MEFILIVGIGCVALFFGFAGILAGIFEHKACKEKKPIVTIETSEQIYAKCCYCPHYATCTKSLEEVIEC